MLLTKSTRCTVVYLIMIVFVVGSHSQDIFDIFNNAKDQVAQTVDYASTKVKEKVREKVLNLKDGENCPPTHTTEYRTVLAAYRNVIKEWLEKFPSQNSKEYRFLIDLSPDDINRLNDFATSNQYEQKDVLHRVHMVSDILKHMVHEVQDATVINSLSWSNWFRSFNLNTVIQTTLVLLAIGLVSFISIRTHLRRGRWFATFVIVAFIVSVIQNWYTLYQEAQAKVNEVLMKKLPKHCQGQSMGFFDMIKAKLGRFVELPSNECREYHIAMQSSPHLQITPIQAISMTFAQLFTTPLGTIGESLSQFFAGTMRHVPILLWPVIILLIIFIAIVVMLMYSRYEVHLPFMMGSLRPSPHTALPQTTTQVRELQDQVESLKLELAKQSLRIEHQPSTSTRTSRPASVEDSSRDRSRSLSSRRSNKENSPETELRQRPTPDGIGFKQEFLPD